MSKRRQSQVNKEDGLQQILQRKEAVVDNIIRIKKSIQDKTISFNTFELECRLDILNSYIEQAMDFQNKIDSIDPTDKSRSELENICVSTKSLLLALMNKHKKSNVHEVSTIGLGLHHSRLPNMRLPKFSGKYSEYKNFISLFESLVDQDPSLCDIEKFNHLLSCLSDTALGTVSAFQISESNYSKALESLKKVYDNTCLIFFENISKLFELPEANKPSASGLRSIVDTVSAIYESLLSIGDEKNITSAILIHLVMSKVDVPTRLYWEEQLDYDKLPLWKDCEVALNKRFQHVSAAEASTSKVKNNKPKEDAGMKKNLKSTFSAVKATTKTSSKCAFCSSNEHFINTCNSFMALPVQQRFEFAKGVPICINCLRKGHSVSKCKASRCSVCNKAHHTLLHQYSSNNSQLNMNSSTFSQPIQFDNINKIDQSSTSRAVVNHASASDDHVILATAVVKIKDKSGSYHLARALLDSGSQVNVITEELSQKLQLKKEETNLNLTGIGKSNQTIKQKLHATVRSRINSHQFSSDFWIMRSISGYQPDHTFSTKDWNLPKNIELADPFFYKPQRIDLLLGAETFFELLSIGQIKINPYLPTLQKTLLGWIVSGKFKCAESKKFKICSVLTLAEDTESLDSTLIKFWELEEIPKESQVIRFTPEQQDCEDYFLKTFQRLPNGCFKVSLPFKSTPDSLGFSFETAKKRFLSLERRLSKDSQLREMYMNFMKEYLDLGHMHLTNYDILKGPHYVIPHQCVLRPQSTTTKLRVVFDASSRTSTQISLNNTLMVGPIVQEELYSTLLRFRLHRYAITADITKMYRQVQIDEADRKFLLILWREDPQKPLNLYSLNTVTYGTAPAPFLATRCLLYLSEFCKNSHPIASKVIREDFYVDDMLTGADDVEGIEKIRSQVSEVLESGGFKLAKWCSSNLNGNDLQTEKLLQINDADFVKALGIHWVPKDDTFKFRLEENFQDLKATKRNILSVSSRLFDPLGLLCPIVVKSKILLQELWLRKLDWDESIPMRLDSCWQDFKVNLSKLDTIKLPRYVHTSHNYKCQIHGFADASIRAYGCCIYVRSQEGDIVRSRLLTAKSKVAPLKTKSLPRLELCAAHLLAKLFSRVQNMLSNYEIENVVFWTDSEITLHWIKTHPSSLTTFVANRVSEIQEWSANISWRHVPSSQNPADIVSRGCNVEELINSTWFEGPEFLIQMPSYWPKNDHFLLSPEEESLEQRKTQFNLLAVSSEPNIILELISKHSSYLKILRIVAYLYRFMTNKYRKNSSETPTAKELRGAFMKIIETIQKHEFADEIQKLKKSQSLSPNIQKLNPFIHGFKEKKRSFEVMRVGGRLLNAPLPYDTKFPMLMPKDSPFMTLYLTHLHFTNCHAGPKAMIAILRQNIWLINAREACIRVVRKCVHCFRYKPKLETQIMGNLPADRLKALRPFAISGVDFCGPVYSSLKIRGRPPIKSYIAVFVCFTSKAVHLELVSDLTSDCFILCLKRFVGRRGLPGKIYCDNATNFVGADRKLKELQDAFASQREDIQLYAAGSGIEFAFIPPRAPHFGGLWESAVKSAKNRLQRTIGNALLTAEELQTTLVEVEAVLNSRPISPLSQDPNDGEALTPAHLLIGEALRSLPPESVPDVPESKMGCLRRWQLLCALKQKFWKAWSRDYVLELQIRNKWVRGQPNLAIGKLVIIHDDNLPPQHWITGRVEAVVTGDDDRVRVADIRTPRGILRRPIHKLAILPMD